MVAILNMSHQIEKKKTCYFNTPHQFDKNRAVYQSKHELFRFIFTKTFLTNYVSFHCLLGTLAGSLVRNRVAGLQLAH